MLAVIIKNVGPHLLLDVLLGMYRFLNHKPAHLMKWSVVRLCGL